MAFHDSLGSKTGKADRLDYKYLIAQTVFISFGIVSLKSDWLKRLNSSTRYEIGEYHPKHISLDNYTQFPLH